MHRPAHIYTDLCPDCTHYHVCMWTASWSACAPGVCMWPRFLSVCGYDVRVVLRMLGGGYSSQALPAIPAPSHCPALFTALVLGWAQNGMRKVPGVQREGGLTQGPASHRVAV